MPSVSSSEDEGSVDPADALFASTSQQHELRRSMLLADEAERRSDENEGIGSSSSSSSNGACDDRDFVTLGNGQRILSYHRYLQHQRYYDDLKHVDCHYIDFGEILPISVPSTISAATATTATTLEDERVDSTAATGGGDTTRRRRRPLIVEQDKAMGKGGLCWDAAFILGEYLAGEKCTNTDYPSSPVPTNGISHSTNNTIDSNSNSTMNPPTNANVVVHSVIELGCGTGVCGLVLALARPHDLHVTLTDLPALLPLLCRNVSRPWKDQNSGRSGDGGGDIDRGISFAPSSSSSSATAAALRQYTTDEGYDDDVSESLGEADTVIQHEHCCNVKAMPLIWGNEEDENKHGTYDWVVGADVVASLYDPIALAGTVSRLCHAQSTVYISFKERLSVMHRQFENEMATFFGEVEVVTPPSSRCRNRNPEVRILVARRKHATERYEIA